MKYPVIYKPQGAIARNLKMKIKLTPTGAVVVPETPVPPCATVVTDVRLWIRSHTYRVASAIDPVYPDRTIVVSGNTTVYYSDVALDFTSSDATSHTQVAPSWFAVDVRAMTQDDVICDGDSFTWDLGGTLPNGTAKINFYVERRAGAAYFFEMYGTPLSNGFLPGVAPSLSGHTVTIAGKLNGVAIDHPRANFTITFT